MTIIELAQGSYTGLDGVPKVEALEMFVRDDAAFLMRNPSCAPYHRPCWREFEVPEDRTAPWGYEWYVVDEAGMLQMHSAQYDSSG